MTLSADEVTELRGYFKAEDLDFDALAEILNCHRTTISKKLGISGEISAADLIHMGRKIQQHLNSGRTVTTKREG